MATPEGKVKQRVKALLDKFEHLYYDMPVPYGYGKSSLDFIGCLGSKFFAIETKAGTKTPTKRQTFMMQKIENAGGVTFLVNDDPKTFRELERWLVSNGQRKATEKASSGNDWLLFE